MLPFLLAILILFSFNAVAASSVYAGCQGFTECFQNPEPVSIEGLPDGFLSPIQACNQDSHRGSGVSHPACIPLQLIHVVLKIPLLDEQVIEVTEIVLQLLQLTDRACHLFFGK